MKRCLFKETRLKHLYNTGSWPAKYKRVTHELCSSSQLVVGEYSDSVSSKETRQLEGH